MHKKQVQAIIGTLLVVDTALISTIDETTTDNIPIISLTSCGILPPQQMLPSILQMSNNMTLHTQFIATIVELAILIFDKAKQLGIMEEGYIWIVSKEIASLLHSLDSSVFDNMQGLSGKIGYKNGKLAENSTFQIINVVGTSYREMAFWSPFFGFCETTICNKSVKELSPVYWPGGLRKVPKGWSSRIEEQPLKVGVPAKYF
ncbi:hypothetical protein QYF36_019718 [Acer negundo]|nr:hypothetical protein QYF36_019718 [Acer negundo]